MYDTNLCTLCDLCITGDEYHYIMICPFFTQSRERYLKPYFHTRPDMNKFEILFGSSSKRTLSNLAKFGETILKSHNFYIYLFILCLLICIPLKTIQCNIVFVA